VADLAANEQDGYGVAEGTAIDVIAPADEPWFDHGVAYDILVDPVAKLGGKSQKR
jgi:hypothetical protein